MLSDIERQEIEAEMREHPTKRSACVVALKVVQKHQRYVSDEALADVSSLLDMTTAELDSIATFYNLIYRKPVGEHVIMVCDSISCWLTGEERVYEYLQHKLGIQFGQTTADGKFTLLPSVCLGHCEQGPVMMLDDRIIGNLTEVVIDEALGL